MDTSTARAGHVPLSRALQGVTGCAFCVDWTVFLADWPCSIATRVRYAYGFASSKEFHVHAAFPLAPCAQVRAQLGPCCVLACEACFRRLRFRHRDDLRQRACRLRPTHPDSAAPPTDPYNPAATQLLDDTQWQLTSWTNADGKARPVPAAGTDGEPITLNLSTANGQRKANGFAGCNHFTGTYDLNGGKLSFGPLASTRMACAAGPGSALETPFLQGLADIEKTGVQMRPPQQLQITLKNGDVMTFTQSAKP